MNLYINSKNEKFLLNNNNTFRTVQQAIDKIAAIDDAVDIDIELAAGEHYVNEGIVIPNKGAFVRNDCRISIKGNKQANTFITGGLHLSGWMPVSNSKIKNLWKINIPEEIKCIRHLYINNRRVKRVCVVLNHADGWALPNDPNFVFNNKLKQITTFQGTYNVYEGYQTKKKEMLNWRNKNDIEMVYDVGWTHCICPVDNIYKDEDDVIIKMRMPCFKDCQVKGGMKINAPTSIENAYELLGTPGQWYFDKMLHTIYYVPITGEDLTKSETILPITEQLVTIEGTSDKPIKNLEISNISFTYSTWLMPSIHGYAEVQAHLTKDSSDDLNCHSYFVKSGASMLLRYCKDVSIIDCTFEHLGSNAIDIDCGVSFSNVINCTMKNLSGGGVQIGRFTMNDAHPEDNRDQTSNIMISNCEIYNTGIEFKGSVPISTGYISDSVITHNDIYNAPYTGISLGWGFGYWEPDVDTRASNLPPAYYRRFDVPTVCYNNKVEYNHIYNIMQTLHDGAGIYTLGLQNGTRIIGNYIHNTTNIREKYRDKLFVSPPPRPSSINANEIRAREGFPGGIYLDEASGGMTVKNNIVHGAALGLFYHDVGIKGRYETNNIKDNYLNVYPDDDDFPKRKTDFAGIIR